MKHHVLSEKQLLLCAALTKEKCLLSPRGSQHNEENLENNWDGYWVSLNMCGKMCGTDSLERGVSTSVSGTGLEPSQPNMESQSSWSDGHLNLWLGPEFQAKHQMS